MHPDNVQDGVESHSEPGARPPQIFVGNGHDGGQVLQFFLVPEGFTVSTLHLPHVYRPRPIQGGQ